MFPWAWGWVARTPAVRPCHLVQPSSRGEYETSEAIDLLIQSGRTIDAMERDGWRIDIGYPDNRDEAENRLQKRASQSRSSNAVSVWSDSIKRARSYSAAFQPDRQLTPSIPEKCPVCYDHYRQRHGSTEPITQFPVNSFTTRVPPFEPLAWRIDRA